MKLIVTGSAGLVGRAVVTHASAQGERVAGFDHAALDITDETAIENAFEAERPDVVINCAAWTDVDGCELDRERAMNQNARGPELLALACRKANALFVTISTDYVFDGAKDGFYTQRDQPNPINIYGASKLEGERRAQAAWPRTVVVRSGYIFGLGGTNFLSTFITRVRRGERLMAIKDSFGTPTYAPDLAARLCEISRLDRPEIYHAVNAGDGASFADFARSALEIAGLKQDLVQAVSLETLKRPAPRPRNTRLRCLLSEAIGLKRLPTWHDALSRFISAELTARV
ncbi:MAG: dTDP-4-dehydrorhamnose reductase [Pyrinomonadaceae bacterium]